MVMVGEPLSLIFRERLRLLDPNGCRAALLIGFYYPTDQRIVIVAIYRHQESLVAPAVGVGKNGPDFWG